MLLLLLLLLHSKYSGLILRRLGAASRNLAAISRDDCEVVLPRSESRTTSDSRIISDDDRLRDPRIHMRMRMCMLRKRMFML